MTVLFVILALASSAFVHRPLLGRLGTGTVQHLIRLPGNLLHELSHAVVTLATGYTVVGFRVSLFDPAGRGHVVPGPAWTSLARPWLTNLLSPVAPAFGGLAALALLHLCSGAPALPLAWAAIRPAAVAIPWTHWQLWLALALAFSVAAEMAPSDLDIRAWRLPAVIAGCLLFLAALGVDQLVPGTIGAGLRTADALARVAAGRALTMAVFSAVVVWPIAWGFSRARL